MRTIGAVAAAILAIAVVATVSAGSASGSTTIIGSAVEGTPTDVRVGIGTGAPVVPYVYSLVNRCWFGTDKTTGKSDSYERFDLVGPWYVDNDPSTVDPYTVVTVNLNPVPAGSTCKVYVVANNTTVKGSTTIYGVTP